MNRGATLADGSLMLAFVVDSAGTVTPLVASAKLSAAYDLLTDDGYPADKAAELLHTAEQGGRDPEALARKMVELRRAIR